MSFSGKPQMLFSAREHHEISKYGLEYVLKQREMKERQKISVEQFIQYIDEQGMTEEQFKQCLQERKDKKAREEEIPAIIPAAESVAADWKATEEEDMIDLAKFRVALHIALVRDKHLWNDTTLVLDWKPDSAETFRLAKSYIWHMSCRFVHDFQNFQTGENPTYVIEIDTSSPPKETCKLSYPFWLKTQEIRKSRIRDLCIGFNHALKVNIDFTRTAFTGTDNSYEIPLTDCRDAISMTALKERAKAAGYSLVRLEGVASDTGQFYRVTAYPSNPITTALEKTTALFMERLRARRDATDSLESLKKKQGRFLEVIEPMFCDQVPTLGGGE